MPTILSEILNLASGASEEAATVKENFEKSYFDCSKLTWEDAQCLLTDEQYEEISQTDRLLHEGKFFSIANPASPFVDLLNYGQDGSDYTLFINNAVCDDQVNLDACSALLLFLDDRDNHQLIYIEM